MYRVESFDENANKVDCYASSSFSSAMSFYSKNMRAGLNSDILRMSADGKFRVIRRFRREKYFI